MYLKHWITCEKVERIHYDYEGEIKIREDEGKCGKCQWKARNAWVIERFLIK